MSKEEQKLVGYIVYDIWTYNVKRQKDGPWLTEVIDPEVHWKKKIYTSYTSAQNAVKDIMERDRSSKPVIIPIYADRTDLDLVQQKWKELKDEVETLNQQKDE
jgi:hypothetical protein